MTLVTGACGASTSDPRDDDASDAVTDAIDQDDPAIPDPVDDLAVIDAAPVALAPGCVAHEALAGHSTWLFFTRPDRPCKGTAGSGVDRNAVDELARLIGSVPAGGRIDGHIFSISVDAVGKALLDAQTRGVDVRLSADGAVATSTDTAKTSFLDKLSNKVYCKHASNTACISTADGAISHTKLFVFSTATAPDGAVAGNVVWLGSANQTYASGARLYNNTVTIYGADTLYAELRSYLGDLFAQKRLADYYDPASGRGHFLAQPADVYASPEAQTDLVVNRLDDITPDDQCRVRVMQASVRDSRMDVVDKLVAMKRGHCHIWVVADTVEPHALAALKAAGIPVHHMPIHDKSFIVLGKFGATYQHRVYTGSHNLSSGSAHRFDEIFVKLAPETVDAHPVYDAYVTHFNDAYNTGAAL
jgi:phosphatidylserine/phosphatidylglycerophosphate/cardiolipin synthase-like enzyme